MKWRFALVFFLPACTSSSPDAVPTTDSAIVTVDAHDAATPDTSDVRDTAVAPLDTSPGPVVDSSLDTSEVIDSFTPPVDVGPDTSKPETSPAAGYDCTGSDFGPSKPETFVSFFNQVVVDACPSSACSDFVELTGCKLRLQVKDVGHDATMEAGDCAAFTRWLTSDLLVSKLRDTVTCYGGKDEGPFESIEVTLTDGGAKKKTGSCAVEPFVSHRACLKGLRAKYFPGL